MDEKTREELEKLHKKQHEFDLFRIRTIEQLKTLFSTVDEIKKSHRWMSQSFIYLLAGGIISGSVALIVWLIQS